MSQAGTERTNIHFESRSSELWCHAELWWDTSVSEVHVQCGEGNKRYWNTKSLWTRHSVCRIHKQKWRQPLMQQLKVTCKWPERHSTVEESGVFDDVTHIVKRKLLVQHVSHECLYTSYINCMRKDKSISISIMDWSFHSAEWRLS